MECLAFALTKVLSTHCVGPSPKTKISFFLLSICTKELFLALKITTFLPQSKPRNEKSERESNPIPYPK